MEFKFSRKITAVLASTAFVSTLLVPEAFASTTNITGGSLTVTAPSIATDFQAITLNGSVQTLSATLSDWKVDDATGTGSGWHVTLQADPLTEATPSGGFAAGTSANTLPQGSLALSGTRNVNAEEGATAVDSTNGPLLQNQTSGIDVSSALTILDTHTGYGMGTYDISEPSNGLTLTLQPKSTYVDNTNYTAGPTPYTTTLTYSVVSGP